LISNDISLRLKVLDRINYYCKYYDEVRAVVTGTDPDCNTCIFAFEGLGGTTGVVNDLHPGGFLKAMMVVTKGKEIVYVTRNASTLPDNRPQLESLDETTTLMPGIYNYRVGDHLGQYIALKPILGSNWPSWYQSSTSNSKDYKDFDEGTADGINIHATLHRPPYSGDPFSQGCQTIYWGDYVDFGKAVGFLDKSKKFESSLDPEKGLSSYMIDLVGTTVQHNSDDFPNEIKYILDRKYDINNGVSEVYPKGIFYPHKEANTD